MSELRADTITASNGTSPVTLTKQSAAKVWSGVSTASAAAGDNFNISSLVDDETGRTSHNFTNALTNVNFVAVYGARSSGISDAYVNDYHTTARTTSKNTSQAQSSSTGSFADINYAQMSIQGDLA